MVQPPRNPTNDDFENARIRVSDWYRERNEQNVIDTQGEPPLPPFIKVDRHGYYIRRHPNGLTNVQKQLLKEYVDLIRSIYNNQYSPIQSPVTSSEISVVSSLPSPPSTPSTSSLIDMPPLPPSVYRLHTVQRNLFGHDDDEDHENIYGVSGGKKTRRTRRQNKRTVKRRKSRKTTSKCGCIGCKCIDCKCRGCKCNA
jgi:hypothetical protein